MGDGISRRRIPVRQRARRRRIDGVPSTLRTFVPHPNRLAWETRVCRGRDRTLTDDSTTPFPGLARKLSESLRQRVSSDGHAAVDPRSSDTHAPAWVLDARITDALVRVRARLDTATARAAAPLRTVAAVFHREGPDLSQNAPHRIA